MKINRKYKFNLGALVVVLVIGAFTAISVVQNGADAYNVNRTKKRKPTPTPTATVKPSPTPTPAPTASIVPSSSPTAQTPGTGPTPVALRTLYVAPTGSDTSDCLSSASACRQISRAVSLVKAGDKISVADGTYSPFHVESKNGTSTAPISIVAQASNAVVSAASGDRGNVYVLTSSWIIIDGLKTYNGLGSNAAGFAVRYSPHVTIKNAVSGNNDQWGIFSSYSDYLTLDHNTAYGSKAQHGIYVSNTSVGHIIRGNVSHDNAAVGIHMNGDADTAAMSGFTPTGTFGTIANATIENNIIYNNGQTGLNMDGVHDSTIRNNVIYNNDKGVAIFKGDGSVAPYNLNFYNNTFDSLASGGYTPVRLTDASGTITFTNNIIVARNNRIIASDLTDAQMTKFYRGDYNYVIGGQICYGVNGGSCDYNLSTWRTKFGQDAHTISGALSVLGTTFATPGSDYHLISGSKAVNAGQTITSVTTDLEGRVRPQGSAYDIGAYEL